MDVKNNPAFFLQIISNIEAKINRHINEEEENILVAQIKNLPDHYFQTQNPTQISAVIETNMVNSILNVYPVDTHGLLKRIIDPHTQTSEEKKENKDNVGVNIESIFGTSSVATLVKQLNKPTHSVNVAHILLDSRYRVLCNDGTEYFTWNHINNMHRAQGSVNSIGNIRDIIEITAMNYRLPAVDTIVNSPYGRISITVDELESQSYVAHENKRFHFMCILTEITNGWAEVCSDKFIKGVFAFNNPITTLNTLTLRFGTPLETIIFDKDRLDGTITYTNPTVITFSENHNLNATDLVYITTFKSINSDSNTITANINKSSGNISTLITPTSISIPIDSSSIISTLTGVVNPPGFSPVGNVTVTHNNTAIVGAGTIFATTFVVGDYIQVQNNTTNPILKITAIQDNLNLEVGTAYTGVSGTFTYRKTTATIVGVGSLFTTELVVGDNIKITDGETNPEFIIKSIKNNISLTLETPYSGLNGAGFAITKNNSINTSFSVFFASKRIFIPLELKYLSAKPT